MNVYRFIETVTNDTISATWYTYHSFVCSIIHKETVGLTPTCSVWCQFRKLALFPDNFYWKKKLMQWNSLEKKLHPQRNNQPEKMSLKWVLIFFNLLYSFDVWLCFFPHHDVNSYQQYIYSWKLVELKFMALIEAGWFSTVNTKIASHQIIKSLAHRIK